MISSPVLPELERLSQVFLATICHLISEFLQTQEGHSGDREKTTLLTGSPFTPCLFLSPRCPCSTAQASPSASPSRRSCNCRELAESEAENLNSCHSPGREFSLPRSMRHSGEVGHGRKDGHSPQTPRGTAAFTEHPGAAAVQLLKGKHQVLGTAEGESSEALCCHE